MDKHMETNPRWESRNTSNSQGGRVPMQKNSKSKSEKHNNLLKPTQEGGEVLELTYGVRELFELSFFSVFLDVCFVK